MPLRGLSKVTERKQILYTNDASPDDDMKHVINLVTNFLSVDRVYDAANAHCERYFHASAKSTTNSPAVQQSGAPSPDVNSLPRKILSLPRKTKLRARPPVFCKCRRVKLKHNSKGFRSITD